MGQGFPHFYLLPLLALPTDHFCPMAVHEKAISGDRMNWITANAGDTDTR